MMASWMLTQPALVQGQNHSPIHLMMVGIIQFKSKILCQVYTFSNDGNGFSLAYVPKFICIR